MAALFLSMKEILKHNFSVCAWWEHCNKLKARECLVHVQSVPGHHQHKQGINLSSKYMVAMRLNLFFGDLFFLCSLNPSFAVSEGQPGPWSMASGQERIS